MRRPLIRRRPVARHRVLAGFLIGIALLAGMIAGLEQLRHPAPEDQPLPPQAGDPRDELVCPDPRPREDRPRDVGRAATVLAVGSTELYDCPQSYDGSIVRYRGEVVGAVLWRRDGAWVQLNDDIYADAEGFGPLPRHRVFRGGNSGVGVFLPRSLAEEIAFVGGPRHHGDVLEVVGPFHRVDPHTAEVTVIRASSGELTVRGRPFEDPPLQDRRVVAAILVPLAIAVTVVDRRAALRS